MKKLFVYIFIIFFVISILGCSNQEQSDDITSSSHEQSDDITTDKTGKLKFKIIAAKPNDIPEVLAPVYVEEKKNDTQQLIKMFFPQTPPGDINYQKNRYKEWRIEDDKAKLIVYPSGALRYRLNGLPGIESEQPIIFPKEEALLKPNALPDEESEQPITYSKEEALNKAVEYIKNHGGLPDQYEAKVSGTQGVSSCYRVTLKHTPINGLPVTGAEKIIVVLCSKGVSEYYYVWREPMNIDNTEEYQLISFEEAIDIFLENIWGNVYRLNSDTIYTLSGGRLVYYTPLLGESHNKWILAWEFKIDRNYVYINAINGELF